MTLDNKENKADKILGLTYKYLITAFFTVIVVYLLYISINETSFIDIKEYTTYEKDSLIKNILGLLVFVSAGFALVKLKYIKNVIKFINDNETVFGILRAILLLIMFITGYILVTNAQCIPESDQFRVQEAVSDILKGDYSKFENDGYIGIYKNQLGLLGFSYIFALVFGEMNFQAFQIMNVCFLVVIFRELSQIAKLMGMSNVVALLTVAMGIIYYPVSMNVILVYGNIPGLAFAIVAIYNEIVYFKNKKNHNLIISIVAIICAMLLKQNYLIYSIGMILYACSHIFGKNKKSAIVVIVSILAAIAAQAVVPVAVARNVSGKSLDQGMSSFAWIAMGFQDGKRAPGWYNSYSLKTYRECDYNSALLSEKAKENIIDSLEAFNNDKDMAGEFFSKKIASQWNNPTFQCFWNIEVRKTEAKDDNWTRKLLEPDIKEQCIAYLNIVQMLILFGAAAYVIMNRISSKGNEVYLLPSIFIGGFLFHLFWEAKCQYTILFFVLLFPYAVCGYGHIINKLHKAFNKRMHN